MSGDPHQPGQRALVAEDLARLRWPMEPAMRPDGVALAFVVSGLDAQTDALGYQLRVQNLESGTETIVDQGRRPRWSPNGNRLAYLGDTDIGPQVHVVESDRIVAVGGVPNGVADYDWSPDGERLYCFPRRPAERGSSEGAEPSDPGSDQGDRQRLWALEIEGSETVDLLSAPSIALRALRCSISGWLALVGTTPGRPSEAKVILVEPGSGEVIERISWRGAISAVSWSPDGSLLAMIGHDKGPAGWENNRLWVLAPESDDDPIELAPGLDRSIGQPVRGDDERGLGTPSLGWAGDGARVLASYADRGRSGISAFDLGGEHELLVGGDRAILEFDSSLTQPRIAFSWSGPCTPGAISVSDGVSEERCTDLNRELLAGVAMPTTRTICATADDGTEVDGWLTIPDGTGTSPLVVQIHGGPHYPIGHRFSFDAVRLAGRGIALLRCNPRGSQGYGRGFAAAVRGDWGGVDFEDVELLVATATDDPAIDESRTAIIGESYGGFMTCWSIAHSDRFVAAIAENPVTEIFSLGFGPAGSEFWHHEMGAAPWADPLPYVERSPIRHVSRINTPVLFIHAEDDETCPITQSESMVRALESLGRPVRFLRVSEEGHFVNVFGRLSSRVRRTGALDDFLAEHLLNRDLPERAMAEGGPR